MIITAFQAVTIVVLISFNVTHAITRVAINDKGKRRNTDIILPNPPQLLLDRDLLTFSFSTISPHLLTISSYFPAFRRGLR